MTTIFVTNQGNQPTAPSFVVSGTDVVLRNDTAPGAPALIIPGTVPANTEVDFARRIILAAGLSWNELTTWQAFNTWKGDAIGGIKLFPAEPAIWWRLHPGVNRITVTGGTATITYSAVWV